MREFWTRMAPYIHLIETGHFNQEVVQELVARGHVAAPVLVVGAGHGLLMEALRRLELEVVGVDYSPASIAGAKARRDLVVQLAEADALPFPDGAFATVIVASGVVDFLDDEAAIEGIVREAARVTRPDGRTLVGFWCLDPDALAFFEAIGVMSPGRFRQREAFAMSRLGPIALLAGIGRKVGYLRAIRLVLKRFLSLPQQEREQAMALAEIWKTDPDPEGLLAAVPADVPMYGPPAIEAMLARFGATGTVLPFRTCAVAELEKAASWAPR